MNFLYGLTLLLIYQLIGEGLSLFFTLSVPGPVIGMSLLFLSLLVFYKIKNNNAEKKPQNDALSNSAAAILNHLSLLFIPAGVGLIVHIDRLEDQWLPIIAAIVLGSIITMAVTAGVMMLLNRLLKLDTDSQSETKI
ncbi:CidA/LrgA family protein [Candidatus Njordibacter sp. Uisw_056]|uniref:CidA/LrgA family protein n=1 Tax=Candidatus Njordibacter sp. Uisw_056 TaxID=3230973 RepID=UPI003D40DCC0